MKTAPIQDVARVNRFLCEPAEVEGYTVRLPFSAWIDDVCVQRLVEVIELPASLEQVKEAAVAGTLTLLSLAASLSYFKAFAPAVFEVSHGLTERERTFVAELISNGLGEFAYVNHMPEVLTTQVQAETRADAATHPRPNSSDRRVRRPLVAVGGGKDSIVTIDAVTRAGCEYGLFAVNAKPPMIQTARVAGRELAAATRTLDPALFALNAAGAPNGHVPVTAINSLIAVLTALALDYDAVVFSNEASSSFGNLVWDDRSINHQWSKSSDFERLLRASLPSGAPEYFSLLRPLTEIRIARRFAALTEYHGVVTSCNRAFRIHDDSPRRWCADCPKCRFVFLMLAPFMPKQQLLTIFEGADLLSDPAQREGFFELMGADGVSKPFECVGEPDECKVALSLLSEHEDWADHEIFSDPVFVNLLVPKDARERVFAWHADEHELPSELERFVREI